MGKRASMTGKGAGAPAKAAKVASSPGKPPAAAKSLVQQKEPAKDDPLSEVFEVLRATCEAANAEMLVASLPLALKGVDGAVRHSFQDKMLDAAAKQLADAVLSQRGMVEELVRRSDTLEQDHAQSSSISADIAARLAEKKQICDDTEEAMKHREKALTERRADLEASKMRADAANCERQDLEKNRDDFAHGLTDLWRPLQASELAGNRWPERNRKLAQLVKKLQEIGVEESLLAGIQTAMKIKANSRGEFAQASVSYAEEAYTTHVEVLKQKVDDFGQDISQRTAAVSEAEVATKGAQGALDEAMEASIAAQNAWADETNADFAHKAKMEAFAAALASLHKELEATRAELMRLETVVGVFEARRTGAPSADAEAAPAGTAPAEPAKPVDPAAPQDRPVEP